jgi:Ni,Fe-hydrogenase III component G
MMGKYSIPEGNIFVSMAEIYFEELITKYKYVIVKKESKKHFALIVYNNEAIHRKIEVKNETNYTDYGFSIFLHNTQNNESNIVVNVPFDKQNKECEFLKISAEFFFANLEKLIAGNEWEKYGKILMQKQ